MFGQAFTLLGSVDATLFMNADNQPLKVKFKGEEGVDIGGPYREFITSMARELHTDAVPLFILCPNGKQNHGRNKDKYVSAISIHSTVFLPPNLLTLPLALFLYIDTLSIPLVYQSDTWVCIASLAS